MKYILIFSLMETVLPFIIAAIVFGFQIYSKFKKEQKKAKERAQQHAITSVNVAESQIRQTTVASNNNYSDNAEAIYFKDDVDEVKRARIIHQPHAHGFKRLDPFIIDEQTEENQRFDLRDAVIKSIILDRPYK